MRKSNAVHSDARHAEDAGKLILRLTLGVLILFHGISKVTGGIGPVTDALARAGMPTGLGYLAYVGEVLGPLLLILGVWTRVGALLVVINMFVALWLVHTSQLFSLSKTGGYGLELQAIYLFTALAVVLLGAGRYSLGGIQGRWN